MYDIMSKDIVYFNCASVSIGENTAVFEAICQQPIIQEAGNYTMAIVRGGIGRSKVPVFIPKMVYSNADSLLTSYSYKISAVINGSTQNITGNIEYINSNGLSAPATTPVDQRSVVQNPFYWTYDLNEFVNMFNSSMVTTWASLQTQVGNAYTVVTKPPVLVLNGNVFTIYFDQRGFSYDNAHSTGSEEFTISFNSDLKYLLDNFNFVYNNSSSNLYPYVLNFSNVISTYTNPINSVVSLVYTQSYPCLSSFSPVESIVFLSDVGDYKTDFIGNVNMLGSGNVPAMANGVESQITDICLDIENPMDYTNMITYIPTQYREINIENTMSINRIKIRLQWKSKYGDYNDVILKDGSSFNVKLKFEMSQV